MPERASSSLSSSPATSRSGEARSAAEAPRRKICWSSTTITRARPWPLAAGSPATGRVVSAGASAAACLAMPLPFHGWGYPLSVCLDQRDQPVVGQGGRYALLDTRLAHVQVDLAGRAADIAEVGIGHFARAIDDTAHDG